MSKLIDRLRSWVKEEAEHCIYEHFPKADAEVDPLLPYGSYFRITLAQMFLSTQREWFREVFPAAHTSVRIQHADYESLELNHVTHVPGTKLTKGVDLNSAVTGLVPYNGGTLEIDCGLLVIHGKDHLDGAIKMLGSFSDLIKEPINQAITVAGKVATSVQDLFTRGNGEVQLNWGETFSEGAPPRPGHYVVIRATNKELEANLKEKLSQQGKMTDEPVTLSVVNDQLMINGDPLTGFDFLLFRIDGVKERPDWRMKEIQKNINLAKKAFLRKKDDEGDDFRAAALVGVYDSADLSEVDRTRVEKAIRDELEPFRHAGRGAVSAARSDIDLDTIMKDAPSWTDAAQEVAKTRKALRLAL